MQVHVRVRNQLAACSGDHSVYQEVNVDEHNDYCSFVYAPSAMPTVSTVSPLSGVQGSTITITGTGFSETPEENFILFDEVQCMTSASTVTSITCVLGEGFGGAKQLYLHVTNVGVADSGSVGLTYDIAANSVDIATGSQGGGTTIIISGSGFYTDDLANSNPESFEEHYANDLRSKRTTGCQLANMVTIGDNPCDIIGSTPDTITCVTPEETGTSSTYDITVSVGCVDDPTTHLSAVLSDAFNYDAAITPSLSGVSPSEGAVHGGLSVVISGSGFMDDISAITVTVCKGS